MTKYNDEEMAAKYGIELFMSECDFVPVEDLSRHLYSDLGFLFLYNPDC